MINKLKYNKKTDLWLNGKGNQSGQILLSSNGLVLKYFCSEKKGNFKK